MKVFSRRSPGARTLVSCLAASAALTLGLTLAQSPAVGHDGADGADDPTTCSAKELAALEAAGDNFADRCFLPGQELAGLAGVEAEVDEGEVARDNIKQIGRVPRAGAFATDDAFGTDMAFKGRYAFGGNYNGFTVYDISRPSNPKRISQVFCPGSQADLSVHRDILVVGVDSSRSDNSCRSESKPSSEKSAWEGLRVFDISNPRKPKYVAAVETDCGAHTQTLAPSKSGKGLFVYASSYSPNANAPDCQPPHDRISVVRIPVAEPARAKVVATPVLFPDGGNNGNGYSAKTSGCHDITAYPRKDLAAGACMGDGILLDISRRANPRVIERVRDETNFAFWHSATFNNAGTKVIFTDELGGGGMATCNPVFGPDRGANGIYDIVGDELALQSYYKMPRTQSLTENCVAHNGSLVPVKGKDIMVQAWYQGGISVFDFTDSSNPVEIGFFDRGAISETEMVLGGSWSAYWYNGRIYSHDITRGLEVFTMNDPRVRSAKEVRMGTFNPQSQPSYNG